MLVIDNVNRFDSGKYSLTLTNSSGTKTAVIVVRILDSPAAPQHFTVKEIKKDSVILTWDTPLNDGGAKITNYIVEKRESVRKAYTTVTNNCTANTLKIEELPEGGIFYFRVSAVNAYGQGQMVESKEIKVSEVPLPPNKIIVVDVTKTSVSLGWEKPAHDGGSKVLYEVSDLHHRYTSDVRKNVGKESGISHCIISEEFIFIIEEEISLRTLVGNTKVKYFL
uniref:Fibronectin type-III domain-containing protein n=1 Tax=Oryzias latipes TaxID=8090 RepID=A0A3B3HZM5_ORYLA